VFNGGGGIGDTASFKGASSDRSSSAECTLRNMSSSRDTLDTLEARPGKGGLYKDCKSQELIKRAVCTCRLEDFTQQIAQELSNEMKLASILCSRLILVLSILAHPFRISGKLSVHVLELGYLSTVFLVLLFQGAYIICKC